MSRRPPAACPDRSQLVELLAASAEPSGAQLESHLESCTNCRASLDELAADSLVWQSVVSTLQADSAELELDSRTWSPDLQTVDVASTGVGRDAKPVFARTEVAARVATSRLFDLPVHPEMLGRLGRFDIESMIGRGGFGTVWKAWDTELNRPVAIKILAEHLAENATARRRFIREAQSAAAVSHPNVVPIHAVHAEVAIPWLVMSYIPGQSLEALVRRDGPLPPVAMVQIGMQVASGLAAAHQQGLVHRDIKPANILIESDSTRALITDFGLARAADDASVTQTGWLAGTPHYMSPEQAQGRDIDARSDLFSLGSVLYFLATGRQAFRAEQTLVVLQQIANSSPLPPRNVNAEVPGTLSRIIMRLLEKSPRDRFRSAQSLFEVLRDYLAHLQHPQSAPRPRLRWTNRVRRRLAAFGLVAASVISVSLTGWLLLPSGQNQTAARSSGILVGTETQQFESSLISPEVLELSRSWGSFESEIRQLESELQQLRSQAPPEGTSFGLRDLFGAPDPGSELERQLETLESGSFLAEPRTANPKQPRTGNFGTEVPEMGGSGQGD